MKNCFLEEPGLAEIPHVVRAVVPGESIFNLGDACSSVFLVISGLVELTIPDRDGTRHSVRMVGARDMLGLPAAISSLPYGKSAHAVQQSVLYEINKEDFLKFLQEKPEFRMKVIACVSRDHLAMHDLLLRLKSDSKLLAAASLN